MERSKALVVMVPFLPQKFRVSNFICSMILCSEVAFLLAICYRMREYLYLKWVLGLHSLTQLIIQLWNERYAEVFQKRSCD